MGVSRSVYICNGDATKRASVQPLSLYTACRGWAVPFQKPQGHLGVGACLSEAYLLRQYRDPHPPPLVVRPLLGDEDGIGSSALWRHSRAEPLAP